MIHQRKTYIEASSTSRIIISWSRQRSLPANIPTPALMLTSCYTQISLPFSTPYESSKDVLPHLPQEEAHRPQIPHERRHRFDRLTYAPRRVNESCAQKRMHSTAQRILQLLLFFRFAGTAPPLDPPRFCAPSSSSRPLTAVSMAVSKISCTPFISFDEHSMYMAPILSATARPCCCVTGVRPWVLRSSMQVRFVRRSDFRPQRMMGVVGQKWRTSGYHWKMLA